MTGAMEALRLVTRPGDAVVVNSPVYPPFFGFLEAAGRAVLEVPLRDGRLDLEGLAAAFEEHRPAALPPLLAAQPHRHGAHPAELAEVARLADVHGVRVVVDEIHAPLVLEGARFTPYLSVAGTGRAFSLMSASKAWNLAGAKAALLVAGDEAADDLARLPWVVSHGPTHLGVLAHTAAYREGGQWLDGLLAGLARHRALLGDLLGRAPARRRLVPPRRPTSRGSTAGALGLGDEPAAFFLERARVALNEGSTFGTGGAGTCGSTSRPRRRSWPRR